MIFKIQKEIKRPDNLSEDSIFMIFEYYFSNRYKINKITDTLFSFKRLYRLQSNGRELEYKQLSINNNGLIKIMDKSIIYLFDLTKQFVVTIFGAIIVFLILWKRFDISLITSTLVILISISFIWTILIYYGKELINLSVKEIKKMF